MVVSYEATGWTASAARWNSTAWRRSRVEFRMNRARAGLLPVMWAKFSYLTASANLTRTLLSNTSTFVAIPTSSCKKLFSEFRQKPKGHKYKEPPEDASDRRFSGEDIDGLAEAAGVIRATWPLAELRILRGTGQYLALASTNWTPAWSHIGHADSSQTMRPKQFVR